MIGLPAYDSLDYIPVSDPAVDRDSKDYDRAAYERDGKLEHLPLRAGAVPSKFTLRRLSRHQFVRVAGLPREEQHVAAVSFGLTGWSGYKVEVVPEFEETGRTGRRLKDSVIDALWCPHLFAELSDAIMSLSRLDPLP